MLDDFEAHMSKRKLSAATIKLRLFYLRKFALQHSLASVTPDDIDAFLEKHEHLAEHSQQTILSSLKVFYRWAHRKGYVGADPTEDIPNVRVNRLPSRIASDFVIKASLSRASTTERAMIMLGAECGLRVSEIASLRRSDRRGMWLVIRGKGRKIREVKMSPELAHLLDTIETTTMRARNYFPGRDPRRPIHPSTAWRHIKALTGMNPHSLRHRAGTAVYRDGKDIRRTQVFLGHASPTTTAIYIHIERDDLSAASDSSRLAA